jgi:fructose-bisphosphate aldolase, class I
VDTLTARHFALKRRSYFWKQDYEPGASSMYDKVHEMRTRIITSPSFIGEKVIGAILFENTMDREVEGIPTCQFLWEKKNVVPFLKVDKGLEDEANSVQLMKPMPELDELLKRAKEAGVYGTKMRSVVKSADEEGIKAIVEQQFAIGKQIIAAGLVPILEPEGMSMMLIAMKMLFVFCNLIARYGISSQWMSTVPLSQNAKTF